MAHDIPPLAWLRAFESAARHRNFTLAATELGLTPAAVSYQVRALEELLGYPLFERKTRPMTMTTMGALYVPWVTRAFTVLGQGTTDVFGARTARPVRLRCVPTFAVLWLVPRLPAFRAQHPDVDLQLHIGTWSSALDQDRFDFDIRFGGGQWKGENAELLCRGPVIPVCHPDLRQGVTRLADLLHAPLIEIIGVADTWRQFFHQEGLDPPTRPAGVQVDQTIAALDLAALGMGHVLAFDLFARPYLDNDRLTPSLLLEKRSDQALFLLSSSGPPDHECALFRDWLLTEVAPKADRQAAAEID